MAAVSKKEMTTLSIDGFTGTFREMDKLPSFRIGLRNEHYEKLLESIPELARSIIDNTAFIAVKFWLSETFDGLYVEARRGQ